jgi:hypothetical protein
MVGVVVTASLFVASTAGAVAAQPARQVAASELVRRLGAGQTVDETGLTVTGTLDLRSIGTVSAPLRCLNCDFLGDLIAPDVLFTRIVVLSGSHFFGTIDLRGAVFDDGFFVRTSSRPSTFDRFALFSLATFGDTAAFDGATFASEGNFTGARFLADASFVDTTFRGVARFNQTGFGAGALFSASTAGGGAPSSATCATTVGGSFQDVAVFTRTVFTGPADFRQRCFRGKADFSNAAFGSRANFSLSQFAAFASFDDVGFEGDALFLGTRFERSSASFVQVSGARTMSFEDASFHGNVAFFGLAVSGALSFAHASFGGGVDLRKLIANDLTMDVETVKRIPDAVVQERVLALIESSARARGDVATANDARFKLLSLDGRQSGGFKRWVDAVLYKTIAGYLVRPVHPLLSFLAVLLLAGLVRATIRRRRDGRRRDRKSRPRVSSLAIVKWLSAFFEGLGDTMSAAFRRKPQVDLTEREQVRPYLIAGLVWAEYLAFKVLFVLFLLCLANSNATLRQILDSVTR